MRERAVLLLKIVCWVLVAVLLGQLMRAIHRNHPFAHVTIPAVPTLASATNAPAEVASTGLGAAKTPANLDTNQIRLGTNQPGTNLVMKIHSTNLVATAASNGPAMNSNATGVVMSAVTNLAPPTAATNLASNLPPVLAAMPAGTNVPAMVGSNSMGTNVLAVSGPHKRASKSHRPPMMGMGMGGFMPGMGMGAPLPDLPPRVRALVDQIVNSELLGPIIHPQPKALMGIAGDVAFLRTDSGQTGMIKVGDTLGDLKLLRIGINRVLVEQNGQPQELTIFNGMGGESLLTTPDKNSNETTNH